MVSCISDDYISQNIELHSYRTGQCSADDCLSIGCSWPPFLNATIAGIQDIHEALWIDSDGCWRVELILPHSRITGGSCYGSASRGTYIPL